MRNLIFGALLWGLCSVANGGEFKPAEQSAVTALLVLDWGQTRYIARSDQYHEVNPLLGRNPSTGDVDKYFAGSILLYNAMAYYLPPKWSKRLSYFVGGMEVIVVGNNARIGVKLQF